MFDILRKKDVPETPEEQVRQWFIDLLKDSLGVPAHMMMSEVAFVYGNKNYRADIVVYGEDLKPVAIVECKRPDVKLDRKVCDQALRYNEVLDVRFIIVTNGVGTKAFVRDGSVFAPVGTLPLYTDMKTL